MIGPENNRELPPGWCDPVPIFHDDLIPIVPLLPVDFIDDLDLPQGKDNKRVCESRFREPLFLVLTPFLMAVQDLREASGGKASRIS
jgi:hypothetical protein